MRYAIALVLLAGCVHAQKKNEPVVEEMATITVVGNEPDEFDGLAEELPMQESDPMYGGARKALPKSSIAPQFATRGVEPVEQSYDDSEVQAAAAPPAMGARHVREVSICPACPACPSCPGCPACPSCPGAPEPEPPKPWWYDLAKVFGGAAGGVLAMKLTSVFGWKSEAS